MCDMRGRGVDNDRGKGPEIGDEGDVHCPQKGLILSQTECLYIKDLVLNKDLFGIFGPCWFGGSACGLFEADLKCPPGLPELRDKSQ